MTFADLLTESRSIILVFSRADFRHEGVAVMRAAAINRLQSIHRREIGRTGSASEISIAGPVDRDAKAKPRFNSM